MKVIGKSVPQTTARRLKLEYLLKMKAAVEKNEDSVPQVVALPKLSQGRPILLGHELDKAV